MGMFNILKLAAQCPHCSNPCEYEIQFKYGNTYQYEYQIGDEILWSSTVPNYDWGTPSYKRVVVEGLSSKCRNCGDILPDYDIFIENNRIVEARIHSDRFDFEQFRAEANIIVLDGEAT